MIRFNCDYSEGAHEKVLEKLIATNREQTQGYGMDSYSMQAKGLIRQICGRGMRMSIFSLGAHRLT